MVKKENQDKMALIMLKVGSKSQLVPSGMTSLTLQDKTRHHCASIEKLTFFIASFVCPLEQSPRSPIGEPIG